MADRTALTVTDINRTGVKYALTAANADGHSVANNGKVFLAVDNASDADVTVTFVTPGKVDGLDVADRTVVVPKAETALIGPFSPAAYNKANGTMDVDFSAVATVTVAAFRL